MPSTPNREPDSMPPKGKLSLDEARARLIAPERRERMMPVLAAAGLAAVSALALAGAVILGPPGMESAQAEPAANPLMSQGSPVAAAPSSIPSAVALRPAG
jgi:hypothetical protein